MNRITVVADDKIPFLKGALEPWALVRYIDGGSIDNRAVEDADALIIRTRTVCTEALLHDSRVRFIATATIGFDHIDTAFCERQGIFWANAPGCNSGSVQQYVASVLANLYLNRKFALRGKTLGIVGVGHVGSKVEKLAGILGMKVLLNDPPRERIERSDKFVPLEKILRESDIVTLHVPLNKTGVDKTLHLINDGSIGQLRPGAWLINTSRGEVVDGDAVKHALQGKKLSGAVLDVWENEPMINQTLMNLVTYATPHIAGYSVDGKCNGTMQVVRSFGNYFNLPLHDWAPGNIPMQPEPFIQMDATGISDEEMLCRSILYTYDVTGDDSRLRTNPGNFEKLRAGYPPRREFHAYRVNLLNAKEATMEKFRMLGFLVEGN